MSSLTAASSPVTPSGTQPTVAKGGRTLREAYLYCVHKYAWPKGTAPARHPFMRPVYDTGLSETLIAAGGTALLAAADSITAHGYPPGLLLIPDGWQDHSGEGGLDRNLYASFRDTADELTRRGFDVMFTVTPYIPAAGQRYIEARRKGMLLKDAEGRPAIIRLPSGYYACLDVTLPEVTAYFGELLDNLRKEGITALRFDCHRALDILPPGERTERYLTAWAALGERYGAAMYPLAEQTQTQWRPYSVALSPEISWESMRRALTDAIHAGLTGYIYPYLSLTSSAGHCSDETMLLRAVQLALFMPIAAVPPDGSLFPTGTCRKEMEKAVGLRMEMNGYMEELLQEAGTTGEPLMRHMEYQFPGQGFWDCTDQYMLGSRYLVAPVLDDTGRRTVRLPRGTWISADGTRYKGPRVINVDVSDGSIPLFRLR